MTIVFIGGPFDDAEKAEAYTAALDAFNVTDPDSDASELDDHPEEDTDEEILEGLRGVARGLRTVLMTLEAPERAANIQSGLYAAALVTTRLLRKSDCVVFVDNQNPVIRVRTSDFEEKGEELIRQWLGEAGPSVNLSTVVKNEKDDTFVHLAFEVHCQEGGTIFIPGVNRITERT